MGHGEPSEIKAVYWTILADVSTGTTGCRCRRDRAVETSERHDFGTMPSFRACQMVQRVKSGSKRVQQLPLYVS